MNHPQQSPLHQKILKKFIPIIAFIVLFATMIVITNERVEAAAYQSEEKNIVGLQSIILGKDIQRVSSDLLFLAHRKEETLWSDQASLAKKAMSHLETEFLEISSHVGLYDQVRLLDATGMELIRINFNNGSPAVIPADQLQNKSGRYYFEDAIKLDEGEVFVSPLDLNIEHGEIEQPLKPTIRFATPIFDPQREKRGIIILNYLAHDMLERFTNETKISPRSQTMLLNTEGYWLVNTVPEKEWGFMFDDRNKITFANTYPDAWEKIIANEAGQFETSQGLFTFETVYPLLEGQKSSTGSGKAFSPSLTELTPDEYFWKVISFIPKETLYAVRNRRRRIISLVIMTLTIALYFGLLHMEKNIAVREKAEKDLRLANKTLKSQLVEIRTLEATLREQAIRDPLTGLFNRRYMDDLLKQEFSRALQNGKPLSVAFLDLDHLKKINDSYGHVAGGDKALQVFASTLKQMCRAEDILCRYAGDEFLIVLHGTSAQVAHKRAIQWKKTISEIKIRLDDKEFGITFSAGVATFPDHCASSKQLMQYADQALYHAKELGRNQVVIYSDDISQYPVSSRISTTSHPSEIIASDKSEA